MKCRADGRDDVRVVVVYQREPHARQMAFRDVPQPTTWEERAALARRTVAELQLDVDVWVDDLGDTSRAAFGDLPNWGVVVGPDGTVQLKLPWSEPAVLDRALDELQRERGDRPSVPCEHSFLDALTAQGSLPRHHRSTMLAALAMREPGHEGRDAWLAELAADDAPAWQRAWARRQPPTIPPGEAPHRWDADMARFAAADQSAPPAPGSVLFVGSSSIRLWQTLAQDMEGVPVVQRGFGGSRLFDSCYWSELLVTRHRPAAVVLFSGTNDIAGDRPKSPERVRELFRLFVQRLRRDDPELPIAWIAITPTPARARHVALVREANRLVREDCDADRHLVFVDPTADLASADGTPDPRFFRADGLHLNEAGYAVWTRHVRPVAVALHAARDAGAASRQR